MTVNFAIAERNAKTESAAGPVVIGIVGAGVMGQGIAQIFARAGFVVQLYDVEAKRVEAALTMTTRLWDRAVEKGTMSVAEAQAAKQRMRMVSALEDMRLAAVAVEAIVEDLNAKQSLFRTLEGIVSSDCILASNTSSLLVTAIAAAVKRPERVCGLHFFNPVPLMKLVEIIPGLKTAPAVTGSLQAIIESTGHTAIIASDMPGFVVNHAGRGFYTEALRIVSEGIAKFYEIDRVLRDAAGFRMGPFQLFDLTGLDVSFPVLTQIYHQFFEEPRFRPTAFIQRQFASGLFGRKTGQGFYEYHNGEITMPAEAPVARNGEARPIWILPAEGNGPELLRRRLSAVGLQVENGAKPGKDSILLTTPVGDDATSSALSAGLDPERTLAIDTILGIDSRLTLMTTAVTRPECRNSLEYMLTEAGIATTVIHDSPGFIAQRVVATIVNIACDIAQQRIATPAHIDLGVRLGLGYPHGPLHYGDKIGARVILGILERMFEFYRDPRYRPSPWLKRRAMLNRSLLTEEA
jgi:3-hydroxybutyryl-CoA dehydrogenase